MVTQITCQLVPPLVASFHDPFYSLAHDILQVTLTCSFPMVAHPFIVGRVCYRFVSFLGRMHAMLSSSFCLYLTETFLICPSGMYGLQQGAQFPQYVPPPYAPAPSVQAAGQMADQTG